jgi:hypothetical protein
MELILIAVLALFVGWKLSEAWHLLAFRKILEALKISNRDLVRMSKDLGLEVPEPETAETPSDLPQLEIRIEQHPEGLFAYQLSDDRFIAQGRDRAELMENLVMNLNNVRVVIAKEDGADLITP